MAKAAIESATEYEKAIIKICNITGKSSDEVKEFYQSHNYSLEHIKEAVSSGCELTAEGIEYNDIWYGLVTGIKSDGFEDLSKSLNDIRWQEYTTLRQMIMEKLENVIYYTGYYLAYPLLWFTDYIWAGIKEAYEDTWGW